MKWKAASILAVLSKCIFILESAVIDKFPGQPDIEDMEEAEVFLCECANSFSLSLSPFLSLHNVFS